MAIYNGKDVKIKIDTAGVGGASATWASISNQRGGSFSMSNNTVDSTTKDNAGWVDVFITDTTWSVSCDGALDPADPALSYLRGRVKARAKIWVQIDRSVIGGTKEEGQAVVNMTEEFPVGDLVGFTLELAGAGTLSVSP